jgi:cation diffusion facilitator CzcD-associated flavoprotein CzcO
MRSNVKVCIIGAGPSGVTACKILIERGIAYDCFEMGSDIGGVWRFDNDNGRSPAYKSLHINSSKKMTQYSDFPMPDHFPDFPHHTQIYEYLLQYVEHFGLRKHITFQTSVEQVIKQEDNTYVVKLSNDEQRIYQYVIVANGHHWKPRFPEPPFQGDFSGESMHSHAYRVPDILVGKDVLIVGIGNSAVDIACEAARTYSGKVVISTRSGAYIIPHYLFGRPIGELSKNAPSRLPLWMRRIIFQIVLWLARGNQENYGIPRPSHPILSAHPTVSQDIFSLAGRGRIQFKPDITAFDGREVIFSDGSRQAFDLIIYCTGYKISFPFLGQLLPEWKQIEQTNELPLYKRIIHPEHEGLFFLGLVQPSGAILPTVEAQAAWIAAVIQGQIQVPAKEVMLKDIRQEQEKIQKRFKTSQRHTIQVEFGEYVALLKREYSHSY